MAEGFEKLAAWQKSMDLAEQVYEVTRTFPDVERFGLSAQMRRSSTSIPSNIAEGYGRLGRGDYLKQIGYARGSAFELKTQIRLAQRAKLSVSDGLAASCDEVVKILNKLIVSLQRGVAREDPP
jgi:four helix bundle protein